MKIKTEKELKLWAIEVVQTFETDEYWINRWLESQPWYNDNPKQWVYRFLSYLHEAMCEEIYGS